MKTCAILILSLVTVFAMGCDRTPKSDTTTMTNEVKLVPGTPPGPVNGGVRDPSIHPVGPVVVNGGVKDPSIKPVSRGGIPDDSIKPVSRGGIPDDSIKPHP